jgi:hypothetical protein
MHVAARVICRGCGTILGLLGFIPMQFLGSFLHGAAVPRLAVAYVLLGFYYFYVCYHTWFKLSSRTITHLYCAISLLCFAFVYPIHGRDQLWGYLKLVFVLLGILIGVAPMTYLRQSL